MIKIRDVKARDRGHIYELLQQDDRFKPGELEAILHRIDLNLFDTDQSLYKVIIAENRDKQLLGYAIYGPDPQATGTYQVYDLVQSPLIDDSEVLIRLLEYIEKELIRYKGRIIIIEISSHNRFRNQYVTFIKNNYNLSSTVSNFYSEGEDKLIFAKSLIS